MCDRLSCGEMTLSPHQLHDTAVNAVRNAVQIIVLDILPIKTKFAGPFAGCSLQGGVGRNSHFAIDGDFLEAVFKPYFVARLEPEKSVRLDN